MAIRVAEICAAELEIGDYSIDDSIFDLGGHSLLMTRMLALVQSEFDCNIALSEALREATVANWSALVERELADRQVPAPRIAKLDRSQYQR